MSQNEFSPDFYKGKVSPQKTITVDSMSGGRDIVEAQRALVKEKLQIGERFLALAVFDKTAAKNQILGVFLFGVVWTGFSFFMAMTSLHLAFENHMSGGPAKFFPVLFLVPFILIGVRLMTAPLRLKTAFAENLLAVTDQRILTFRNQKGKVLLVGIPLAALVRAFHRNKNGGDTLSLLVRNEKGRTATINLPIAIKNIDEIKDALKKATQQADNTSFAIQEGLAVIMRRTLGTNS